MNSRSSRSIVTTVFLLSILIGQVFSQPANRIRASNRHYRQGDWVTHSTTRFVRHLTIGLNEVFFATTGGITRFNHYTRQWQDPYTRSDGLADNDIYLVAFDLNTGYLWCVTAAGISYLEPASQLWYNIYNDEMGIHAGEKVQSVGIGGDRRIILVTERQRWFASHHTSVSFSPIATESGGTDIIWHGRKAAVEPPPPYLFMSDGLMYNEENRSISDTHLRRFQVTCWARDTWQTLWLGTWGLGAGRADLNTSRLDLLPHGLWNPVVMAMATDDASLWLGGVQQEMADHAGLTRWYSAEVAPEYLEPFLISGFHDDRITAIAADDRMIWFGTRNGLTRYDKKKNHYHTFSQADHLVDPRITDLALDETSLWVGTGAGLARVARSGGGNKDTLVIDVLDFKNTGTTHIYDLDHQADLLWAGTEFGLYRYDKKKKTGSFYSGSLGPGTQRTYAVACHGEEVWYATDRGISALVEDDGAFNRWPQRSIRNEPVDTRVHRMIADETAIWAASDGGLIKLDRSENRWVRFTVEDGLPDQRVYCLSSDGDYLWLGTPAGLSRFYWNAPYRID